MEEDLVMVILTTAKRVVQGCPVDKQRIQIDGVAIEIMRNARIHVRGHHQVWRTKTDASMDAHFGETIQHIHPHVVKILVP